MMTLMTTYGHDIIFTAGLQNQRLPISLQKVSPEPTVKLYQLGPRNPFMVLASDGLWNSLSEEEVRGLLLLLCAVALVHRHYSDLPQSASPLQHNVTAS